MSEAVRAAVRRVRGARAALLADIASGRTPLSAALERGRDDEFLADTHVVKVVEAHPGLGKVSARRLLDEAGIGHRTALGMLTDSDLVAIAAGSADVSEGEQR